MLIVMLFCLLVNTIIYPINSELVSESCNTPSKIDLPERAKVIIHIPDINLLAIDNIGNLVENISELVVSLLVDNASKLLIISQKGEVFTWQITDLDGNTLDNVRDSDYRIWQLSVTPDNRIIFYDFEEKSWQNFSLITGETQSIPTLENYEVQRVNRFDPATQRVFYIVSDKNDQQYIRLENLYTKHTLDIPFSGRNEVGYTWSSKGTYFSTINQDSLEIRIYDSNSGELLYEILPPQTSQLDTISNAFWSNNEKLVAFIFLYREGFNNNNIYHIYTYDIDNKKWLEQCFKVEGSVHFPAYRDAIIWAPDDQIIWWINIKNNTGIETTLDLSAANINTGEYGVVSQNVGEWSNIGYEEK